MNSKIKTLIVLGAITLVAVSAAIIFTLLPDNTDETLSPSLLINKTINDVLRVDVANKYGKYSAWREETGYILEDIPADSLNIEYLGLLLDESSKIEYLSVVNENPENLNIYGLAFPEAVADIQYTDGSKCKLILGAKEELSGGRYFMLEGNSSVYLMDNSRAIRHTMPVTKYIDFVIIPPRVEPSVMGAITYITFEGKDIPNKIEIKALSGADEDVLREAISFGVTSHIMTKPQKHGIDLTSANEIFGSIPGIITDGVLAYNCTDEQLKIYGFDDPYMTVNFTYKNGKDAVPEKYMLKISHYEGSEILLKNDEGIVYKISEAPFTSANYEKLVAKRFIMPVILDVAEVEITTANDKYEFVLAGDNKNLEVIFNGNKIDTQSFRQFYNLLVSSDHDGKTVAPNKLETPLLTIRYKYKDTQKQDDLLEFYSGNLRRNYVNVNGICEFETNEKYVISVMEQLNALKRQ